MDFDARIRSHTLPYLAVLFGCSEEEAWDRPVTWQTFDDREKPESGAPGHEFSKTNVSLVRVLHGTFRQHHADLEGLNREGAGVFLSVNETDLQGRRKTNITVRRAVWADLDTKLASKEFTASSLPICPSIIVATGHGWHVYWIFGEKELFTDESKLMHEEDLKRIQAGLEAFGADPKTCQVQQVLRVPGYFNRKRLPHPLVELVMADPTMTITRDLVLAAFPQTQPNEPMVTANSAGAVGPTNRNFTHAQAYMQKVDGVAEGQRSAERYRLACFLVRDKALPDEQAFELLKGWNARCMPPEAHAALWDSIRGAHRYGQRAIGSGVLPAQNTKTTQPNPQNQTDILLNLVNADLIELFHTSNRRCFARMSVKNGVETFPVKSQAMSDWIRERFWRKNQQSAREECVESAMETLGAKAQFDGALHEVSLRVARHDDSVYLDTCRSTGEILRVGADGWTMIAGDLCPVRFLRSTGMLPLPIPERGGSIANFRPFVFGPLSDFQLLVAWCISAMAATGQYPLLGLFGEAGSAKSFLTLAVRSLVDPSDVPFQGKPANTRDLYIRASHSHCIALNNLSEMPQWLSDDLCGIALGSGFETRKLNTDLDEIRIQTSNAVVINGIPNLFRSADLADRGFPIVLDRIPPHLRIPERELWNRWDQVQPQIFGALLDLVAGGLRGAKGRKLAEYPRLADVAVFLDAAEEALVGRQGVFSWSTDEWGPESWRRGDLLAALLRSQRDNANLQIFDHPLSIALLRWLDMNQGVFTGTSSELLQGLNGVSPGSKGPGWPKQPNALSAWLRVNGPALRSLGFDIERIRGGGKDNDKLITLRLNSAMQKEGDSKPPSGDSPT